MEDTKKLIWENAKLNDLVSYLDKLGFQPKLVRNHDYWYLSPFRNEKTPSFKVNRKYNVWFDHGSGEGGTIIDFGIKLFKCTPFEFVKKLSDAEPILKAQSASVPAQTEPKPNRIEILSVGVIQDPELIRYLNDRSIRIDLAKQYCVEVEFRIDKRTYKAIGFRNHTNGYELRNHWFKGSSTPKDFTFINHNQSKLSILEGFIDFLSLHQIPEFSHRTQNSNFLILNSLSLLNRSLPTIQLHLDINLFLDNDLSGRNAKALLTHRGIRFKDASTLYQDHKDLNEYLMSESKKKQGLTTPKTRSMKMRR